MRIAYYAGASTAAAAVCLVKAFHERPNFYSATVYLSQSNACLLILTNLSLLLACSTVYALQRLLYGPLRPIEIEQLSERAWYAVLDTLLAMPSFREDVGGWLLTMFVLLLSGKVWGWIGEGRVDVFEQQPPQNPRLFHTRLAASLLMSVIFDICMVKFCFETVVADPRPGMMVIFTFEFAILLVFSTFTLCRYILNIVSTIVQRKQLDQAIELRKLEIKAERLAAVQAASSEGQEPTLSPDDPIEVDENEVDVPGWEEKRRYLFGLEMTADFIKLLLYIVFFTVSITFNGLPMHIMRDVYMTFTAFTKRLSDYVNYKKATSDMNARYPDATTEEIRGDACIVCREDMVAWQQFAEGAAQNSRQDEGTRAKKLPCGHILHLRCLKAWLERQQVCPTCRRPVVSAGAPLPGNQPNAAVPIAGNNAPAQRHPGLNRARFFNFGPLRVGFLNGPVAEVDNVVNQLRGVPPQAPPQAPPQQLVAPVAPTSGQPQPLIAPQQGARLSQDELMQISNRMLQETTALNVEQTQLLLLRSMAEELNRLQAVHRHNTITGRLFHPAAPAPQTSDQTYLTGHSSQQLSHGQPGLPEGLVLPAGWTVMPLHQAGQTPVVQQISVPAQQISTVLHPQPTHPAQTTAPLRTSSPDVRQPLMTSAQASTSSNQDSAPSTIAPALSTTLSEPPAVSGSSESTGPDSATTQNESKAPTSQPWTSQAWDFDNAQQGTSETAQSQDKGKGKAVAIEDVPDSES